MERMIYLLSLLFVGVTFAQETPQSSNSREDDMGSNMQDERPTFDDVKEMAEYTSENQKYIFKRDNGDIQVYRTLPDGQQEDFGRMRKTTLDGFYVITSTETEEVSFGSFDEKGNLQTYKYDPDTDTVVPQDFISFDPIEKNLRKSEIKRQRQKMKRNINKVRKSRRGTT